MKHEKIIKREDGSKVKISISFYSDSFRPESDKYRVAVQTCAKRKRTWINVTNSDDYSYRCLSMDERSKFAKEKQLEYVSKEEILSAKLELWEKLKPT